MFARAVLALAVAGCGLGEVDPEPIEARLWPPTVHSGHDGTHSFRVPVSTDLPSFVTGDVTWSIADEAIASIAPATAPPQYPPAWGVWAMVTTKQPGTTTITATLDPYTVTAELVVATYTGADTAAGDARYNDPAGVDDRVACASCHQQAGGPDHSPTEMAFHPDDALLLVTTAGHYPDSCVTDEGDACTCGSSGCTTEEGYVLQVPHSWTLTPAESDGIVPYLRSLPPAGFQ